MKRISIIAMAVVATLAFAAPKNVAFGDVKVQLKIHTAPEVEFRSKTSFPGNSVAASREWVMIAVSFAPGVGSKGRVKAMRGAWVDDVVLDVSVEAPMDGAAGRRKATGLFIGSCKFWAIPLDGRSHTALMFIAPQVLDRYLASHGGGDGKYTEKLFRVQAVFHTADGAELGRGYFNLDGSAKTQALYFASLANETVVKDAVFPREKTPWALVNPENYDLMKE
ncbi:MAG: hypothetical protein MJ033_01115 [Victivallaceae bacterium]|nr:hypothetical protein [Victivallaceae bacterium]